MIFLPIVQRELREVARKRGTFRVRMWVALLTSIVMGFILLFSYGASLARLGKGLFVTLSAFAFVYCFLEGARNAADCVSEEKREGTLGLLFLTDLHGYDIVLGKFASISIRSFQGLFAFFPVLATALIFGGITGGEFWRMMAVLVNALFFALCVGMWISCLSRDSHKALAGTFSVLAIVTILPFLLRHLSIWSFGPVRLLFGSLSPAYACVLSRDIVYSQNAGANAFWVSLITTHLAAWILLIVSSLVISRVWQERSVTIGFWQNSVARSSGRDSRRHQEARQRRLDENPMFWLAARNERESRLVWLLLVISFAAWVGVSFYYRSDLRSVGGFAWGTLFMQSAILKCWMLLQGSRHLAQARRNQALELFLVTPVSTEEIINGHWLAARQLFTGPVSMVVASQIIALCLHGIFVANPWIRLPGIIGTAFGALTFVADLFALWWVGMWMGLSQKSPVQAIFMTVLVAVILPIVLFCVPSLFVDLALINWAKTRLAREFRRVASERPSIDGLGTEKQTVVSVAPKATPSVFVR